MGLIYARFDKKSILLKSKISDKGFVQTLEADGNVIMESDPGFIDSEKGDYRIKSDCRAYQMGFEKIPFHMIGLFLDEFRRKIPEGQNNWNR